MVISVTGNPLALFEHFGRGFGCLKRNIDANGVAIAQRRQIRVRHFEIEKTGDTAYASAGARLAAQPRPRLQKFIDVRFRESHRSVGPGLGWSTGGGDRTYG